MLDYEYGTFIFLQGFQYKYVVWSTGVYKTCVQKTLFQIQARTRENLVPDGMGGGHHFLYI